MKRMVEIFELDDGSLHEGIYAGTFGGVMVWDSLPFAITPQCPRYIKSGDLVAREPVCELTLQMTPEDYMAAVRRKLEEIAARPGNSGEAVGQ